MSLSGIVNETDPKFTCHEIHVGAYIEDFVFYSTDPAEEEKLKIALERKLRVDFMSDANFFLGTVFTWLCHNDGHISVHLSQSAFTEFAANRFDVKKMHQVPNMTPYHSGFPINSLTTLK